MREPRKSTFAKEGNTGQNTLELTSRFRRALRLADGGTVDVSAWDRTLTDHQKDTRAIISRKAKCKCSSQGW